jgi:hypothetical protein
MGISSQPDVRRCGRYSLSCRNSKQGWKSSCMKEKKFSDKKMVKKIIN